ncbi:hypothetical protein MIR68_002250 [Amoeboaphelidium protococcarum]|nr:hypothetical protein MIR68_002250 [Amoeboaphelidium protococcarum]
MNIQDLLSYLPPGTSQGSINQSASSTTYPKYPRVLHELQLTSWDSFDEDIIDPFKEFVADKLQLKCNGLLLDGCESAVNEQEITYYLLQCCFHNANQLAKALNLNVKLGFSRKNVGLNPDLVLYRRPRDAKDLEETPLMTVEVKTSWGLDVEDNLVAIANDDRDKMCNEVRRVISQEYGYMSVNHHRYGMICTDQKFFFLRRGDPLEQRPNQLQISRAIYVDKVTPYNVITAVTAMYLECSNNQYLYSSPYSTPPFSPTSIDFDPASIIEVPLHSLYFDAVFDGSQQFSVIRAGFRQPIKTVLKMVDTSKDMMHYEMKSNQSDSNAATIQIDVDSEKLRQIQLKGPRLMSLDKEHQCYLRLKNFWGEYLPTLHARLSLDNWIECIMIDQLDMASHQDIVEQQDHLRSALKAFHENGIAHNDVAERNIMRDIAGKVMFIDFAYARLITDGFETFQRGCNEDLSRLEKIIKGEHIDESEDKSW